MSQEEKGSEFTSSDFIGMFMDFTEGGGSPDLFRKWSGLSLLAASVERRIWTKSVKYTTFPHIFVMLVASPGVGKQVIDDARSLAMKIPGVQAKQALRIAPDSMTKASMMDELNESKQTFMKSSGGMEIYHSLYIAAEEVNVFMSSWDRETAGMLTRIYNSQEDIPLGETRRTGRVQKLEIVRPQVNLLMGVQPVWLAELPELVWKGGFIARTIMIYSNEGRILDLWNGIEFRPGLLSEIQEKLKRNTNLWGQFSWTPEAANRIGDWHKKGGPPAPVHSKLEDYVRRRTQFGIKLSMLSAVSRSEKLIVTEFDVVRALKWLIEAEALMPDIFRAIVGRSDHQVIEELHYFVTSIWQKDRDKGVDEDRIIRFLSQRVPSEKIAKIIDISERSGVIVRYAGTYRFRPGAKDMGGIE